MSPSWGQIGGFTAKGKNNGRSRVNAAADASGQECFLAMGTAVCGDGSSQIKRHTTFDHHGNLRGHCKEQYHVPFDKSLVLTEPTYGMQIGWSSLMRCSD